MSPPKHREIYHIEQVWVSFDTSGAERVQRDPHLETLFDVVDFSVFGGGDISSGKGHTVLAKKRRINQILEIQMHPVSQTQPELVFKNTTPLLGGLAKRELLGIHTMDFLGIT